MILSGDKHNTIMGGAVDGDQVSSPQRDPGLTWALVVKRAAQASAAYVVARDFSPETAQYFEGNLLVGYLCGDILLG